MSRSELAEWCQASGESAYRADQVRRWIFAKRVECFDDMLDLPAGFRNRLSAHFQLFSSSLSHHLVSEDGTEKLLLEMEDGASVECVLMREDKRRTVCISTQVGCGMGCVFCASGLLGLKRNLTTGELLEQVLWLDRRLSADEKITNVVVMGIGEPLANLQALLPALDALKDQTGMGLGARRITISTVGLPDKIRELAEIGVPYNLAVSLHAPNDDLRTQLVPVNRKISIDAILEAADYYFNRTGRRVTYEYVLLGGINDETHHARELAGLLRRRNAHVNLIPMNDVTSLDFHKPSQPRTRLFREILERDNINVTIRKRKGADIDAACGQLRLRYEEQQTAASETT